MRPRVVTSVGQGVPAGVAEQDLPGQWVNAANMVLLSALRRWAPQAIDWASMQYVLPALDAFEAAG